MNTSVDIDLSLVDQILDDARHRVNGNGTVATDLLIPMLQEIQDTYGYLPFEALRRLSQHTGIPESHVQGVITFYSQFYREPRGKHTITLCCGTACHVRGGNKLLEKIKKGTGVSPGETSKDLKFTLEATACLGACALAPLMVVDNKYHGKLTGRDAEEVIQKILNEQSI